MKSLIYVGIGIFLAAATGCHDFEAFLMILLWPMFIILKIAFRM